MAARLHGRSVEGSAVRRETTQAAMISEAAHSQPCDDTEVFHQRSGRHGRLGRHNASACEAAANGSPWGSVTPGQVPVHGDCAATLYNELLEADGQFLQPMRCGVQSARTTDINTQKNRVKH